MAEKKKGRGRKGKGKQIDKRPDPEKGQGKVPGKES